MISATENNRTPGAHVTILALTQQERTQLRALLNRVIEDIRNGSKRTGEDWELAFETERIAREFRRRL